MVSPLTASDGVASKTAHGAAVEWDLSRYAGKQLRLYVVDAETNHFGQIAISEISIQEEQRD